MNANNTNKRINRFDNLRGLAIFLVVLGHMAFSTKFLSINYLHSYIFIFHLAILFFVAGYFSKIDLNQPIKIFKRILVPYILFTIIYWIIYIPFGKPSEAIFIYPTYALWFLLSLFFMKMALPILDKLRYPILFTFILALLFGFIKYTGDILSLSRTFCFLPVFLTGFYFNEYKARLREKYSNISSALENSKVIFLSVLIAFLASISVAYFIPGSIIMMKFPYDGSYLINIAIRALIIVLGIAITLIINRFMTDKECFLTKWGRNSMAIYILHIFFIVLVKKFTESFFYSQSEIVALLITFILSFLIVIFLSQDWISKCFNRTMEFFANLILKDA